MRNEKVALPIVEDPLETRGGHGAVDGRGPHVRHPVTQEGTRGAGGWPGPQQSCQRSGEPITQLSELRACADHPNIAFFLLPSTASLSRFKTKGA